MKYGFYIIAFMLIGCATRAGIDATVLEHQRQVTELEDRNTELERRLTQYDSAIGSAIESLEAIEARGRGVEGTVDEIIDLFNQYQRGVERLTQAYNELRATLNTED
jgi:chromosome segregation ATPase